MASTLPYRPSNGSNGAPDRRPSLISVPSSKRSNSPPAPSYKTPPLPPSKAPNGPFKTGSFSYPPSSVPSQQSSVGRKRRRVRSQYPAESNEKHVEYILVASFDIDRGSTMEHQYPAPIGGDEHMLAELMLPEGTHQRSQDWTMFFLHKDTSEEDQAQQERREERKRRKAAREQATASGGAKQMSEIEDDDGSESEEDEDLRSIEGPPLVYVLNLVNTKQDTTARRGAVVKAMAICTRHSFLHIYKPLLLLALEEYFRTPVPDTLASLYDAANSMDLSMLPKLSLMERMILQASDVKDLFVEKFEAMIQKQMRLSANKIEPGSSPVQTRHKYGLPRDTHEFDSIVHYKGIPVPVKIPTAVSPETVGDFSLIQLITTFSTPHTTSPQPFQTLHPHLTTSGGLTHPIVVLLNALLTQKRVIFIGHNMPSSNVAEAVLAASALASGGLLRGFVRHAFPYTDLTKIDDLLKVPGFIAGVTNPTFSLHEEWWDVLCDLPTGRMRISPKIEQAPLTEGVLFFQQPGHHTALMHSTGLDQKSIGAIAAAGASLSAGLGGTSMPISGGVGDPTGDNAFMASILQAISERRGEAAIRAKFRLWVLKFTRLAAAFEEMVYGASALQIQTEAASPVSTQNSPSLSHSGFSKPRAAAEPLVTGYGYVWPSPADKIRELAANATRIEGWSKTRSYYNFVQDLAVYVSYRAVKDIDLQHQHDKLTKLRLGTEASGAIYTVICNVARTYEEINQLLGVVVNTSPHSPAAGPQGWGHGGSAAGGGGLFYLALGLFHPKTEVREAIADLLARIREHEAGRHFWSKLGAFERAAWDRVMYARREREEMG